MVKYVSSHTISSWKGGVVGYGLLKFVVEAGERALTTDVGVPAMTVLASETEVVDKFGIVKVEEMDSRTAVGGMLVMDC